MATLYHPHLPQFPYFYPPLADPSLRSSSYFINSRFFPGPKICITKNVLLSTSTRFVPSASDKNVGKLAKEKGDDSFSEDEFSSSSSSEYERDVGDCDRIETGSFPPYLQSSGRLTTLSDSISLAIKEPIYEVIEVRPDGIMSAKNINRRQLLKSSGLRLRDIRSVDPSMWLTNSMPSLLVREQAILLNLGSLRAIAMPERVLIFDYNREGGKSFLELLLPRLNPKTINGGPSMPFELEVVEAALLSRIQRYERRLMDVEPRVGALLEVLPNRLTADILEQLRLSKQTLVELGSRAGALKQMLLDILEDPHEIRRICVMGRNCTVHKGNNDVECILPADKQIAEEEEEEIEMLLENYLQRCESCHGQAERLLDSAREMEDSIAVNLSSRRLEVSRVELLLQVGTFCVGVGALVAGIFGMNLKSYLEEHIVCFDHLTSLFCQPVTHLIVQACFWDQCGSSDPRSMFLGSTSNRYYSFDRLYGQCFHVLYSDFKQSHLILVTR